MALIVERSKVFKDVRIFKPEVHEDHRGENVECYNDAEYQKHFPEPIEWKCDTFSVSRSNVLRGLHGDKVTWKLVQCLQGKVLLTICDCNPESPTYKLSEQFYLTEKNRKQVLIPPFFANGHLVIDRAIFSYKQSTYYQHQNQFTVNWNLFDWPDRWPKLSKRDSQGPFLEFQDRK